MTDSKQHLRQSFREARRRFVGGLSTSGRSACSRDLARVVAPALCGFTLPGSYAAVGDEIDPVDIEHGFYDLAFPRIEGREISFRRSRWDALTPGAFGIPEPPAGAPRVTPDLLLIPAVAVTLAGVRLGQGKGYYDRTLAAMLPEAPARTVVLAWDCQIADALPSDAWDIAVDFIATPTRLVDCRAFR